MSNQAAHLDLLTMKLFVAVVDEGSIARAAWRENIAASAVSKRISEMEAHFGTQLLIRRRQGVEPTPAGGALLPHCRDVLSRLVQVEREMCDFGRGVRGQIRISANESATVGYLPADIAAFLAEYPAVQVNFQVDTSPVVVRKVIENGADIGVFAGNSETGDLAVRHYRDDNLVAVLPCGHALAEREWLLFHEMLDGNFVGSEANGAIETLLQRAASVAGRRLATRIRVGSFDAACRFVEAGLGAAIVPEAVARPLAQALDITFVALKDDWARRELKVCMRERTALPPATVLFVDALTAAVIAA